MTTLLQIVGGLNEKELIAADYVELPQSGQASIKRRYDSQQYGWMRQYNVKIIIRCFKRDIDTVIGLIPTNPSYLTSDGGKNNDGTRATRIQWGDGYVLQDITPSSPSPSFVDLQMTYTKEVPEAEGEYPTGLTVECSAGVHSVRYEGVLFKTLDNGLGACGTDGLEFVKGAQQKRKCYVYTSDSADPHVYMYKQQRYRWYNILNIYIDGVLAETASVLIKEENIDYSVSVAYDAEQAEEVVISTEYLGTSYSAELLWNAEAGARCQLLWSGLPIWDFVI